MIYENELKQHKRTNFNHRKGLITFKHVQQKNRKTSMCDRIMQQIRYFTMSIHGVAYIWEKDVRFKVRLFWIFVLIAAIVTCCFMYMTLSYNHNKKQIKTVVRTSQMPIYKVNFPAVALCPWQHVNWLRHKTAEEKFLPPNADMGTKNLFTDLLLILDNMELSKMDSLALIQNYTIPQAINKISLDDLVNFMAFRCDDLFVECVYDETIYDCCKLFVAEPTEKGICMVFNSLVSEESRQKRINDKFYPWKNRKAGEKNGLQFTLRYNRTYERNQSDRYFGIDVMIKESEEWSESFTNYFLPNTKSYLSITYILSDTSPNTRHFDPRRRRCLFADERSKRYHRIEGLPYNKLNCIIKCQQMKLVKVCKCSLSWFFPKTDIRECTVADFKCIYDNKDILTYIKSPLQDKHIKDARRGVVCDCVNSCYTLNFLTHLNANKIPKPNYSFPIIQGDINIGQGVLTKYETRMQSTTFDLIAKFGGILGLCLGASILSLAEVIYASLKIIVLLLLTKCFPKRTIEPQQKLKLYKK